MLSVIITHSQGDRILTCRWEPIFTLLFLAFLWYSSWLNKGSKSVDVEGVCNARAEFGQQ